LNKLTTAQLANYLVVTKRTIQRKAIRERWKFQEEIGLGGTKRVYPFATLPQRIKNKVIANIIANHDQQGQSVLHRDTEKGKDSPDLYELDSAQALYDDPGKWLSQHCFSLKNDNNELNKDFVKLGLLTLARLFVSNSELGKIKGFDVFCDQYNDRTLEIDIGVFFVIKRLSRITLLRWEKKEQELASLQEQLAVADNPHAVFDRDLRTIAEEVMMVSPTISAKRLRLHFLTFFSDRKIPNEQQLNLWIRQSSVTG
jgi:putative transposase